MFGEPVHPLESLQNLAKRGGTYDGIKSPVTPPGPSCSRSANKGQPTFSGPGTAARSWPQC